MDPKLLTVLLMGSLFFLMAIGCPIAFASLIVAMVSAMTLWGPAHIYMLAASSYGALSSQILIAVPLFILMGNITLHTGIARDVFNAAYYLAGRIRGSLAMGTVIMGALFAAFSGSGSAQTATIGKIALPGMRDHGYEKGLIIGTICVSGVMAFLIPPSITAIILCSLSGLSVGRVYLAMFVPGFLLTALYLLYIGVRCYFQPHLAPAISINDLPPWYKRLIAIKSIIAPCGDCFRCSGRYLFGCNHSNRIRRCRRHLDDHLRITYRIFELAKFKECRVDDVTINIHACLVDHRRHLLYQCLHCPRRSETDSGICRFPTLRGLWRHHHDTDPVAYLGMPHG